MEAFLNLLNTTIGSAAAITAALAAMVAAWHGWRNSLHIQAIHVEINSRLSELLSLTAKSSFNAGAEHSRISANS